jgi:rhamnosyltransferase
VDLVDVCITSGNLVRTSIWRECGGYDDSMFIDGVDFDFCLSVKERNKKVIRINKAYLLQEVGQGYARKIAGKTVAILNHSYLRLYYISRNYLYLGKKHGQLIRWISPVLKRMLLVALYEQNKIIKIRYMLLGCWDFILGKMGKCRY